MIVPRNVHVRLYKLMVGFTPPSHQRRHGVDQVQLFADLIGSGEAPWRLWLRALPDLISVSTSSDPHSRGIMSFTARLALVPLSGVNLAAGTTLAGIALFIGDIPMWVAPLAAAVALQGVYTLGWLTTKLPFSGRTAHGLFVVGETAALLVGVVGLVVAVVAQTTAGHPEYGPLAMLAIVTVHAAIGLLAAFTQPGDTPTVRVAS